MKTAIIHFGDEDYIIAPLTFQQIETALPLIAGTDPKNASSHLSMMIEVVALGVAEKQPGLDIRVVRGSLAEIKTAFTAVLELSGFQMGSSLPGEALAGANSTSTTSEAA